MSFYHSQDVVHLGVNVRKVNILSNKNNLAVLRGRKQNNDAVNLLTFITTGKEEKKYVTYRRP